MEMNSVAGYRLPNSSISSIAEKRLPYAAGLDGLRALAVLAVVLYHIGQGWFTGGFFGVEVFFVISGYLITSLLLAEWERRGSIDLKGFWLRRARRLLPALFAMVLAVLAYAVILLPNEVAGLRRDALAAFFYVTNWYLIFDHKSYFEAVGRPPLLQHLWSLAIEEQFYLLWPVLFSLGIRKSRRLVLAAVLIAAATSAELMAVCYLPDVDPSRVYFGTDTRASGLLLGVALSLLWRPWLRPMPLGRFQIAALDSLGVVAIAGIGVFCLFLNEYDPFVYQGGFVFLALATAVAIAVVVHPASHLGHWFLGRQPFRWIGLRSYSIYLWHWPVFMLTRPQLDVPLAGWPLVALRLALVAILAELSYRLVETPFRRGALGRLWRSLQQAQGTHRRRLAIRWAVTFATVTVCLLALGVASTVAQPPPQPSYLPANAINTVGQSARPERTPPSAARAGPSVEPLVSGAPSKPITQLPGSPPPGTPASPAASAATRTTATPAADRPRTSTAAQRGADVDVLVPRATTAAPSSPSPSAQGVLPSPTVPSSAPIVRATIIGDSVVLSAWAAVHQVPGLEVDGEVGRQASDAIAVLRKDDQEGFLAPTVVIHIGNNGPFSARQFDEMMSVLGNRRVIFMTVRVARDWEGPNNVVIREGVKRYPNAELLDWHAASASHPEWFRDDGLHTSEAGAKAYASMIAQALDR